MGEMAGKGKSSYNIKQEGKSEWLWDAHLNRSSGGLFTKHNLMMLSNIRKIDKSETLFVIILNMDQ